MSVYINVNSCNYIQFHLADFTGWSMANVEVLTLRCTSTDEVWSFHDSVMRYAKQHTLNGTLVSQIITEKHRALCKSGTWEIRNIYHYVRKPEGVLITSNI